MCVAKSAMDSMAFFTNKKLLLGLFFLTLAVSVPLTLSLLQQRQETRSRATGSTALSLTPASSTNNPLQKNIGDTIALDMMVNPGNNLVTFVRFQVKYDPTKLELLTTDPFTLNTTAFPTKIEGPVLAPGIVAESVSVGSDPTKAIQTVTKVGTLNFKAIGSTGSSPTVVSFSNLTQALSSGSTDQAAENVLASTTPAIIAVGGSTPTGSASGTIISFNLLLHGIGSAGDNANPTGNSLSNKTPLHADRNIDVLVYDNTNQLVSSKSGTISYASASGTFTGKVDLGASFPTGNYNVKIKTNRYLRKLIPGIVNIVNLKDNPIPQTFLVAGDTNDDNILNVLDYNALLDCGYGALDPLPMGDAGSIFKTQVCQVHTPVANIDVDDNGIVNSPDYNIFLRELSVQSGD
jgi:hypothetical protein